MGVAETERVLTRVAEERQRERDDGLDEALLSAPELLAFLTLHAASACQGLLSGEVAEARTDLLMLASLAVRTLEQPDEELAEYGLPADDVASGA